MQYQTRGQQKIRNFLTLLEQKGKVEKGAPSPLPYYTITLCQILLYFPRLSTSLPCILLIRQHLFPFATVTLDLLATS